MSITTAAELWRMSVTALEERRGILTSIDPREPDHTP